MINLTNTEQFTVGGIAQETNTIAGVTSINIDYVGGSMSINISTGSLISNNIQPSQHGQHSQVSINTVNGVCTINSVAAFTIGSSGLNNINTALKNIRNQLESAMVAQNLVNGSQVSW